MTRNKNDEQCKLIWHAQKSHGSFSYFTLILRFIDQYDACLFYVQVLHIVQYKNRNIHITLSEKNTKK